MAFERRQRAPLILSPQIGTDPLFVTFCLIAPQRRLAG